MFQQSFYGQLDRKAKYVINCCFFMFFVNGLYGMLFGSLLPIISERYHLSDTVSGLLISAQQIGNLLAGFLSGIVPLYLGFKRSLMLLSSLVIIGFVMLIVGVQHGALLCLAFLLIGISRGSVSNFTNKTVNDVSNSSPQALNLMHALFAVGALSSPFLLTIMITTLGTGGWKLILVMISGFIIMSQLFFAKAEVATKVTIKKKAKVSLAFLKDRLFWVIIAILFFYMCSESAITGWLVKYFADTGLLSIEKAQLLSSFLWLGILVGRVFCFIISGNVSRKGLLLVISLIMLVAFSFLLASQSYGLIIISVIFLGVGMGGIYPTAVTLAGQSIKEYPMAMGWILVTGGVGATIAPTVVGSISERLTLTTGMQSISIMITCMIISMIGYIWLEHFRKKVKKTT